MREEERERGWGRRGEMENKGYREGGRDMERERREE